MVFRSYNTHSFVLNILPALPEGETRKKAVELTPALAVTWHGMTTEEKLAATHDGVKELRDLREAKRLAKQNVPLHAFNDARATLESVADTVRFLFIFKDFNKLT